MKFQGKKVTIMGLGLLGGGVEDALFFIKRGAKLTITDLRSAEELKPSLEKLKKYRDITYTLGEHREKDFTGADLILKNPGVPNDSPYLEIARENKIPVYSSAGILFDIADMSKLVGITGTKGKSTTASLLYDIIKLKDKDAYVAGLPGISLLKHSDKADKNRGVVELSSWQLEGVALSKKSPHIAIVTNIQEDHLDRHGSLAEYTEAKKNIFKYQTGSDYLLIPKELKSLAKNAESKIVLFSADDVEDKYAHTAHKENVAAALKVAEILGIDKTRALEKIKNYKGMPGRLEFIANLEGIKVYNDTTATNPFAALHSIRKFENKKVALIAGGKDKDLNYREFAENLKDLHFVALLQGTASDKIEAEAMKDGTRNKNFQRVENLKQALKACLNSKPEIILFSPAAASFNMFTNEFDRGDKFVKEVKKMQS